MREQYVVMVKHPGGYQWFPFFREFDARAFAQDVKREEGLECEIGSRYMFEQLTQEINYQYKVKITEPEGFVSIYKVDNEDELKAYQMAAVSLGAKFEYVTNNE